MSWFVCDSTSPCTIPQEPQLQIGLTRFPPPPSLPRRHSLVNASHLWCYTTACIAQSTTSEGADPSKLPRFWPKDFSDLLPYVNDSQAVHRAPVSNQLITSNPFPKQSHMFEVAWLNTDTMQLDVHCIRLFHSSHVLHLQLQYVCTNPVETCWAVWKMEKTVYPKISRRWHRLLSPAPWYVWADCFLHSFDAAPHVLCFGPIYAYII